MKNWREFKTEILVGSLLFLAASAIFIVNVVRGFSDKEGEFLEHFGSFIGGYVGSLFSLGVMLLLFATLRAQRQASEDQNFETKYFALLTLHRSNVEEMRLWTTDESGRRIFLILIQEVRDASNLIQRAAPKMNYLDHKKLFQAAYYVMFFGVGQNSTRMLLKALDGIGIEEAFAGSIVGEVEQFTRASAKAGTGYIPFDGHQSRLGHYYRHLYQMVRYVDQQSVKSMDRARKYEYVKTIRAQLSTHEQALLLLNSLTPMGRNWWQNDLITRYRLVKNIPGDFFDRKQEIDVESLFPATYFEFQEVAKAHLSSERTDSENPVLSA